MWNAVWEEDILRLYVRLPVFQIANTTFVGLSSIINMLLKPRNDFLVN